MMWFVRFMLWAALLVWPAYWLAAPYQQTLMRAVGLALGIQLADPSASGSLDLTAANSLVVFAALCLSSTRTDWRRRMLALLAGVSVLVLIEWLVGLLSVLAAIHQARGARWNEAWGRTWSELTEIQRWVAPPVLWLLLLGRRELAERSVQRASAVRSSSPWLPR
jgi:hypothetical protein